MSKLSFPISIKVFLEIFEINLHFLTFSADFSHLLVLLVDENFHACHEVACFFVAIFSCLNQSGIGFVERGPLIVEFLPSFHLQFGWEHELRLPVVVQESRMLSL